jgi:hypothetical protein
MGAKSSSPVRDFLEGLSGHTLKGRKKPLPSDLSPPPPDDPRWTGRDRFGLPKAPLTLLTSTPEEFKALATAIEVLIADLHESATAHLGRDEADRLFIAAAKKSPPGKSADDARNSEILQQYDERLEGLQKRGATQKQISAIPMQLAKDRLPKRRRDELNAAEETVTKARTALAQEQARSNTDKTKGDRNLIKAEKALRHRQGEGAGIGRETYSRIG